MENEKIQMLYTEIRRMGNPLLFQRLCEIAVKFRDYEKLLIVMYALKSIKGPLTEKQRIAISEVILGKRSLKVRSGLIYWAYDNGQRGISTLLMDLVLEYLNIPNIYAARSKSFCCCLTHRTQHNRFFVTLCRICSHSLSNIR